MSLLVGPQRDNHPVDDANSSQVPIRSMRNCVGLPEAWNGPFCNRIHLDFYSEPRYEIEHLTHVIYAFTMSTKTLPFREEVSN